MFFFMFFFDVDDFNVCSFCFSWLFFCICFLRDNFKFIILLLCLFDCIVMENCKYKNKGSFRVVIEYYILILGKFKNKMF